MKNEKTDNNDIYIDEWIQAINDATMTDDGGVTRDELEAILGRGREATLRMIRKCAARGLLTVGRRAIVRIDGHRGVVPTYKIAKK